MNKNIEENLRNTSDAISVSWRSALSFELEDNYKMADYAWDKILTKLEGMWSMANWCLHCDDTMDFISDLKIIAMIHQDRVINELRIK